MTNTCVNVEEVLQSMSNSYLYLLAVSTDSLYVISPDRQLVETIIKGVDNKGYVVSAEDEDVFLESISLIKQCILNGQNPIVALLDI